MKKRVLLLFALLFGMVVMAGCDPIYPERNLKIEYSPKPLPVGTSTKIEMTYPNDGIASITWDNQSIEIISGDDIVEVSALSIKGLKSGTAVLQVTATATLDRKRDGVPDEKTYTAKLKVKVVDN